MKVILSPMDRHGCGHYRMLYPMAALQAEGYDVAERGKKLSPCEEGVVVLQRPTSQAVATETIPKLQAKGYAVVVELDDDLSVLHPRHTAFKRVHPQFTPTDNFRWLQEACLRADLVTCSTPALAAKYAPHGRVAVLPNYIPAALIASTPAEVEGRRVFGWPGLCATHPHDLDVARRAVGRIVGDWSFLAIGDEETLQVLGVRGTVAEWTPMAEYVPGLRRLDLGIVPLRRSEFNEAKSWLKGLELAAAGVPFVASPTEPYRALNNLGAGLLADTEKDWVKQLRALSQDAELRREVAEKGLQAAAALTYEQHATSWWEAWLQARANYEGRRLSPEAQYWVRRRVDGVEF